jgi:hypothetical protein
MHQDENKPHTEDTAEDRRDEARPPAPRGNPETDHESVEKSEQQLDKVSGN